MTGPQRLLHGIQQFRTFDGFGIPWRLFNLSATLRAKHESSYLLQRLLVAIRIPGSANTRLKFTCRVFGDAWRFCCERGRIELPATLRLQPPALFFKLFDLCGQLLLAEVFEEATANQEAQASHAAKKRAQASSASCATPGGAGPPPGRARHLPTGEGSTRAETLRCSPDAQWLRQKTGFGEIEKVIAAIVGRRNRPCFGVALHESVDRREKLWTDRGTIEYLASLLEFCWRKDESAFREQTPAAMAFRELLRKLADLQLPLALELLDRLSARQRG